MRISLISTSVVMAIGIAMSALATPAAAATSCEAMFGKVESMAAKKTNVAKKVKGYQMAINGYQTCSKAVAMANGAERDSMMKEAEQEFENSYAYFNGIE